MHNLMQYNVHLYRININCISKCFIYPSHANYMEYNKESVFILSNKLYPLKLWEVFLKVILQKICSR